MSKKVFSTVLSIASIAVAFIPGIGPLIKLGLTIGLGVLSALTRPKAPKVSPNATNRLTATLDPNAPRKIALGHTALATDVRYQAYTGTDQEYVHWILAVASHEVHSIDEIWFDSEMAWSTGGGVTSKYSGYLTVAAVNPGTNANGIAIDAVWTSTATLTGCAYLHLRFKTTGNDKKAESPFTSIPSRVTIRGKGALLPDVREGGCDASDQATWDWFSDDSGRNPALQLLFYLIGWRINDKLAVGRGIPVDRIDLDSFITAANLCDETVTLAVGGTEPRYRSDVLFSEGDDPSLVIGNLCDSMNALLRDTGGKIAVVCLHNDLSMPVAAFTEADIVSDDEWNQTPAIDQSTNVVRGRYVDASDAGLYQLTDYPQVTLDSLDGIDRIDSFDLPAVQSASQAQRLAKQRLERNQYPGTFSAQFTYRAWQVSLGDVVTLSHVALGWTAKLFRVTGAGISFNGLVSLTLREENSAIYAWDADESPAVVAAAPEAYDYLNNPLIAAASAATLASFIQPDPPPANESTPGVIWLDSDDGYRAYVRITGDGFLQLDGADVLLDGAPVELAWTAATDQRLHDAIMVADAALDALADIDDDGVITIDEKVRKLIPDAAAIEASWGILDAQAATFSITTERTAAASARTAWLAVLAAISPAWNDITQPSPVTRSGLDSARLTYRSALDTLDAKIKAVAATLATWNNVQASDTDAPDDNADVTLTAQVTMVVPADPTIQRDISGTVLSGQLPRTVGAPGITRAGASITTSNNVSYTIQNIAGGLGTVTIDNTNGSGTKGESTVPSAGFTGAGSYEVLATIDGVAQQPIRVTVSVQNAEPTVSGSKAGSMTVGDTITGTSFVQVGSAIVGLVKATGETIRAYFGGSYSLFATTTSSRFAEMKWQYSVTGLASWTDLASAVNGTAATYVHPPGTGTSDGSITCNQTVAPANGTYDLRLVAAVDTASGSLGFDGSTANVLVGV